jgi:UPF0176 protein
VTPPGRAAPIVNIAAYRFVAVDDADALAARLRESAAALGLLGTILVADEGLNLFLAGPGAAIDAFLDRLREDARFAGIAVKRSPSRTAPFARLKVRRKRETITFRQGAVAPLAERAPALAPAELARWIACGGDDAGRRLVLLDTRNREEVRHGTFAGALTLPIDRFTDFPAAVAARRDALAGAAVVSFCTGGIRCEKAAPWMRANGFGPVWQLDGGILGYFEQVGGYGFDGRCFVFDQRVALDPSLQPAVDP